MLVYTVVAQVPAGIVDAYVQWLLDGHVQAVVAGGATSATVVRLEGTPPRVESRYLFASRAAYDAYAETVAPGLRSEGIDRFVTPHGVVFSRTFGQLEGRAYKKS